MPVDLRTDEIVALRRELLDLQQQLRALEPATPLPAAKRVERLLDETEQKLYAVEVEAAHDERDDGDGAASQ